LNNDQRNQLLYYADTGSLEECRQYLISIGIHRSIAAISNCIDQLKNWKNPQTDLRLSESDVEKIAVRVAAKIFKELKKLNSKSVLQLRSAQKSRDLLSDSYVKKQITKADFKASEIPADLVELQRAKLKFHRELKNKHQNDHN